MLSLAMPWFDSQRRPALPGPGEAVVRFLVFASVALAAFAPGAVAEAQGRRAGKDRITLRLVNFATSPFPYDGMIPDKGKPFLDVVEGERRGHTSPRGGVYWEHPTYSDRRVLLAVPRGFDRTRPAAIVVFFHGNKVRLQRDVIARQQVPRQVAEAGINALLVAPQFAVDALDSSAGRFWQRGAFDAFLREADEQLARMANVEADALAAAPVILVVYSGGYLAAACALAESGAAKRIRGVVLLDALYDEAETFAAWIMAHRAAFFVTAYSESTKAENLALRQLLARHDVAIEDSLPPRLEPGAIAFIAAGPTVEHNSFVTRAWTRDPLKAVLRRWRQEATVRRRP